MTSATPFDSSLMSLKQTGRVVALAVQLAWRASPQLVAVILLLMVAQAALQPIQLWLSRAVIDRAALDLGAQLGARADSLVARFPLGVWVALAAVSVAAVRIIQPLVGSLQSNVSDRLTVYAGEQLILAADRLRGVARFEDPQFADDLQRARAHSTASVLLLWAGGRVVVGLFTIGALVLTLFYLHPAVPGLFVLTTLPYVVEQWRLRRGIGGLLYDKTPDARRLEYSRNLLLTADPAKDVRLYALAGFVRRQSDDTFRRTNAAVSGLRRRLTVRVALASAVSGAAPAGVYLYVVWSIGQGTHSLGDLALYGGAAALLQGSLQTLTDSLGIAQQHSAFLPSLSRVLDAPPDLPSAARAHPVPRPVRQGIVFEHVAFHYPGTSPEAAPILRDVSFTIGREECLALVGHNGTGKTTVVKLLLRLYDPTDGRILLDGVDLRGYDLDDLRRQMGAIFQDFARYELTAGENVGVGQIDALHDRERLLEAAAKAGAAELIQSLPKGLDTPIGRQFGGRDLSGGEWQKLALARAFVRDAQLLVLDEPTASLDVQTEYDIYKRFHDLTRGRMTLLISHRFSTVRMADHILVLGGGRVVEAGTHEELVALAGRYATLYEMQAGRYR